MDVQLPYRPVQLVEYPHPCLLVCLPYVHSHYATLSHQATHQVVKIRLKCAFLKITFRLYSTSMNVTPVLLIILDGFGYREDADYNAILAARKPNWDKLWQD